MLIIYQLKVEQIPARLIHNNFWYYYSKYSLYTLLNTDHVIITILNEILIMKNFYMILN